MLEAGETAKTVDTLMREDMHPDVVKQVAEARREQLQTYGGELSDGELSLYGAKLASAPEGVRLEKSCEHSVQRRACSPWPRGSSSTGTGRSR